MQYFKLIKILLNLSIALFLTLSLSSYNTSDPSFNNKTDAAPNNLLGEAGSYIADIIMQLFGLSGFLIILIPLFWAHRIWRAGDLRLCVARLFVSLLTLCAASLLLSYVNGGNAGAIGVLINHSLKQYDRQHVQIIAAFTMLISFYFAVDLRYDFLRNLFSSMLEYLKLFAKFMQRNKKDKSKQKKNNIRIAPSLFKAEVAEDEVKEKKEPIADSSIEEVKSTKNKNSTNLDSYILPSTNLLKDFPVNKELLQQNNAAMTKNRQELAQVLSDFGVTGDIIGAYAGPVVTLYELEPSAGTKSSRIIGLSDDIARSMRAIASRIAVIPGRNAIGIELPNKQRETVYLKELLESKEYRNKEYDLPIILGKDIAGNVVIADLARMPHLLVAGTTGSGKSVAINTMILSLVYSLTPEQCRFIMIDPKMLELSIYDNIPHLLTNVVTEPGKAVVALKWVVKEMENRYRLMSNLAVRNIHSYNSRIKEAIKNGEIIQRTVQTGFDVETGQPKIEQVPLDMKLLPFIVVIVDEMADLMLVAGKDIESSIQRLAQMARAAGIHIIMATQRPSVDVITGVIKANFPTRISFQVTSKIDSRTILGEQGAEALLGKGDMLYMAGGSKITRIHGPFVADNEVEKIVSFLKSQGAADYMSDITVDDGSYGGASASMDVGGADDDLYRQAVEIVQQEGKASTSFIQRCLKIGYNRAANIIEQMEKEGLVSKPNHVGKREILM